ncbi:MAG: hypothetical protein WCE54_22130 [Ignavibacteriaceae bacterium]
MKILAIEKEVPGIKEEQYIPHLKAEALKVWELYQSEKIREIYFSQENFAVIILECCDEKEASEILRSLPLVKEGLIEFDIIRLMPYNGFRRLFGES